MLFALAASLEVLFLKSSSQRSTCYNLSEFLLSTGAGLTCRPLAALWRSGLQQLRCLGVPMQILIFGN